MRRLFGLFIVLSFAFVLIACGTPAADTGADAGGDAGEAEAAPTEAPEEEAAADEATTDDSEDADSEEMANDSSDSSDGGEMMASMEPVECVHDLTGEEIVLHQQAGREGPLASILGQGFALATEDAVGYINENGGVCGATITVEFCETNYASEMEVTCYESIRTADPKPFILFTYGSAATVALKDRVVEDEIVNLAAGLNAQAFYDPADGYTFGVSPIYSDQFAGFVQFLVDNWADIKPEGAGDDIVVGVIGWANAFGAGATTDEAIAFAESLGVTVLPLEEQAISPDTDVSGSVQTLALNGANVIYSQALSFGTAQVIGAIRASGLWDSVIAGTVNWGFNTDVLTILGENIAIADGFYGVFPYPWWSDTDLEGVQIATELFEAAGHPESERATTYLTTVSAFLMVDHLMEVTLNEYGPDGLTGANIRATMESIGQLTGGDVMRIDAGNGSRASHSAQIRQWSWNGESMDYTVVQDWFELPDTRP